MLNDAIWKKWIRLVDEMHGVLIEDHLLLDKGFKRNDFTNG